MVRPTNDPPIIHVPGDHRNYSYDGLFDVTHVDTVYTDEDVPVVLLGVKVTDVDADDMQRASSADQEQYGNGNVIDNGFFEVHLSAFPNATLVLASHRGLQITTQRMTAYGNSVTPPRMAEFVVGSSSQDPTSGG